MASNYMTMTTNKMKKFLTSFYAAAAKTGDFRQAVPAMLWGQPGIGKSELVTGFAKDLAEAIGKTVNVRIISLLLMMPTDLRGIPSKAEDANGEPVARWLTPEIFKLDPSANVVNILFFDELSAAPQTVQAAAYQITNERHVGEHYLPDNTLVIAAGNRVTDRSVAYKMPKALGNRLMHFEVQASVDDWKAWAYSVGIDDRIIGFVNWKPDYLNGFDANNDDVAFPTPRSWANVNKALASNDFEFAFPAIAGIIGLGVATEFKAYISVYTSLPSFKDIGTGKINKVSEDILNNPALKYAVCSMLVSNMKRLFAANISVSDRNTIIDNVGAYLLSMPDQEYRVLAQRDMYNTIPAEARMALASHKAFAQMLSEAGNLLYE